MRPLYALQFEVASLEANPPLDVANQTLVVLASWISEWYLTRKNIRIALPLTGGDLSPCEGHELAITVARSADVSHSTISWSYPDERDGNLLWHSKCEISKFDGLTEFSFQLLLESIQFYIAPVEFVLRRPRVIATLLRQFACSHGDARLSDQPRELSAQQVPEFVANRLLSRNRRLPIVIVSRTSIIEQCLVDPSALANRLAGIAEVYVLDDKWSGFALSDEVGKIYSCYNGAVRLYWPDFDSEASPYSPVYTPDTTRELGSKLVEIIFNQLAAISAFRFVPGPVAIDAINFLQNQKAIELESIKAAAQERGDYAELLSVADEENALLREKLNRLQEENADGKARLQLSQENLRAVWQAHEDGPHRGEAEPLPEESTEQESLEDVVRNATSSYASTLVFLDSATSSAQHSPFKQPKRAAQALLAMHEVCQAWRQSRRDKIAIGPLEQHFVAKGFVYKPRESMTSKGKWAEEYETTYHGRKVSIEQHVAVGKGGPDTCLRIHFYTDEKEEKFIVAHVGRHKTNTSA